MRLVPCAVCKRKWVPECLLSSTEPPITLQTRGFGRLVEAQVARPLRKWTGTNRDAIAVSEALPFLEYELHRVLMLKLKLMGCNSAWSLRSSVQIGSSLIVGSIVGTAVFLEARS
jgi:hypothetical protein